MSKVWNLTLGVVVIPIVLSRLHEIRGTGHTVRLTAQGPMLAGYSLSTKADSKRIMKKN